MGNTFCFPTVEGAALFAATHDATGVYTLVLAHRFPVFFVTVRPRPGVCTFTHA